MKTFGAAVLFFAVTLGISAIFYAGMSASSSDVFSLENARIDHTAPQDGRLGWAARYDDAG
jgi:hypothetical protein